MGELEGHRPGAEYLGAWPISSERIGYGWGNVTVKDWPEAPDADSWAVAEPAHLDERAKAFRSQFYQRLQSIEECRRVIASRTAFVASLPATEQWFDAPAGEIRDIEGESEIIGIHSVALIGYDDIHRRFDFINSWGRDWGKNGLGTIPYRYVEKHVHEIWMSYFGPDSREAARDSAKISRNRPGSLANGPIDLTWAVRNPVNLSEIHCREIYDVERDERMGWAFATIRQGFLDVDDLFVKPFHRRRGFGGRIAQMLLDLSAQVGLPLRLQVSFADVGSENREALLGILRHLGMSLRNTSTRGLAYVALPGATTKPLSPIVVPPKPTLSLGAKRTASSVSASAIGLGVLTGVESASSPIAAVDDDVYWRSEAERITPANDKLREMIGKYDPPADLYDDSEEMPY